MKGLLLLTFTSIAAHLSAQESPTYIDKLIAKSKLFTIPKDSVKPLLKPFTFKSNVTTAGVYALPQDGMPCIVPDTRSIAAMPNAAKGNSMPPANRMPNAAPEQRLLPKQKMDSK